MKNFLEDILEIVKKYKLDWNTLSDLIKQCEQILMEESIKKLIEETKINEEEN